MPNEFTVMSDQLRGFAKGVNDLIQRRPEPGSLAAADRVDLRWNGLGASRPSLEAALLPAIFLGSSADHVRGLAACLEAEGVLFSVISLIRPTLEATASAFYMLEPGTTPEERVRRWLNYRLSADVEMLRMVGSPRRPSDGALHTMERIAEVTTAAPRHQLKVETGRRIGKLEPERWIGTKTPPSMKLGEALLDDLSDVDPSGLLNRLASAVIHSQLHGLTMFMVREEATASGEYGVMTVPFGISMPKLAGYTAPLLWGIDRCMKRACRYNGHDVNDWTDVALPVLLDWRERIRVLEQLPVSEEHAPTHHGRGGEPGPLGR